MSLSPSTAGSTLDLGREYHPDGAGAVFGDGTEEAAVRLQPLRPGDAPTVPYSMQHWQAAAAGPAGPWPAIAS